jgi:hypothetical protein
MMQFDRDAHIPKTYGEAYEALTKYGTGLSARATDPARRDPATTLFV